MQPGRAHERAGASTPSSPPALRHASPAGSGAGDRSNSLWMASALCRCARAQVLGLVANGAAARHASLAQMGTVFWGRDFDGLYHKEDSQHGSSCARVTACRRSSNRRCRSGAGRCRRSSHGRWSCSCWPACSRSAPAVLLLANRPLRSGNRACGSRATASPATPTRGSCPTSLSVIRLRPAVRSRLRRGDRDPDAARLLVDASSTCCSVPSGRGVAGRSPYELRHTAISLHAEAGHSAWAIADWAGMSERMIAVVYRHKLAGPSALGPSD